MAAVPGAQRVLGALVHLSPLVLGTALTLLTFGLGLFVVLPASIGLGLVVLVLQAVAAVRAGLGIEHRYPCPASWRLVR